MQFEMEEYMDSYEENYESEDSFESYNSQSYNVQNVQNSDDEFYNMKVTEKTKLVPVHEKYGVSAFDVKIAKSITAIHRKQRNYQFSHWVEKNYYHLCQLYKISGELIPMQDFFTFIYDTSQKSY